MPDPLLYEQRRYSAALIQHSSIGDFPALRSSLSNLVAKPKRLNSNDDFWTAFRAQYLLDRNLYPEHLVDRRRSAAQDRHPHDLYLGFRDLGRGGGGPTLLLASPYVRLLSTVTSALAANAPSPGVRFLKVDMSAVYAAMMTRSEHFRATRVTLQVLNEPELELVSLAGRNPLNSKLHAALTSVAAPYAVRSEIVGNQGRCRVNVDRHGNLWWYQPHERHFTLPLLFIDAMASWSALTSTRSMPLRRRSDEDNDEL